MKDLNAYWKECLTDKRVIITGGSTGIGREIALLLASLGARCLICGRNQEQIDETLTAVSENALQGSCAGIIADMGNGDDIEKLFAFADEQFNGVDVLINNAAIAYGSIVEGNYQDWDYAVRANLTGYLACAHHAASRMEAAGKGHIINIGSISADSRDAETSVYVATKAGIQGFSEALRKELNPKGIGVTLIEPGAVDTDMQEGTAEDKQTQIDNQEMLPASDIAIAVAFCLAQTERCDIIELKIKPRKQIS